VAAAPPIPAASAEAPLASEDDKTLYALGLGIGRNLSSVDLTPAELALVERGLRDSSLHRKAMVELTTYGPKVAGWIKARNLASAEREKERGKAYLAERATKEPGAEQRASGLVFWELASGQGQHPTAQSRVKVHYRGTLIDGSEFDSSYKHGEPATFPLSGVIPCWTEALQLMRKGGHAKLVCPASIAYGDVGRPPTIPGGATLTFEVELLDIVQEQP
jgi:FKBP-type peptidyl-prolyl cis-trans isomerase FkpA